MFSHPDFHSYVETDATVRLESECNSLRCVCCKYVRKIVIKRFSDQLFSVKILLILMQSMFEFVDSSCPQLGQRYSVHAVGKAWPK